MRVCPFHFDQPDQLAESLRGADALINTYWVRFDHRLFAQSEAVANTRILFEAAKKAGVRRIVHVEHHEPGGRVGFALFSRQGRTGIGLGFPGRVLVLWQAILFGKEDVLINNIAWSLRHLPVIGVFGAGDYRVQPIYVDDLASAAAAKAVSGEDEIINAIGPETFAYRGLVELIRETLGLKRLIVSVPPGLGYWACRMVGVMVRDVVITREEIRGLMEGRLYVEATPLGTTKLSEWIARHKETLGRHYTSELARRVDRVSSYPSN